MPLQMKPASVIKANLGIQNGGKVHAFFTEACYKAMDKYVPMDKGDLRTNVDVQTDKIVYESPYARYQYYGMREDGSHVVKNYTTPGTGTYWDKRMWTADGNDVLRQTQNYLNRGGK